MRIRIVGEVLFNRFLNAAANDVGFIAGFFFGPALARESLQHFVRRSIIAPDPSREAGEVIEDDGEAFGRIVGFLEDLKVI